MPPYPCPTKTYHTEAYPAIDPTLPSLSTAGKKVFISGGGSGIGPAIAKAFARSNASEIALLGRTESTLLRTKGEIEREYPNTNVSAYVADITDAESLKKPFASEYSRVGPIDILVANAGYLTDHATLAESSSEDFFRGLDVNVKGNFNLIRAFIPYATKNASILNISSGMIHVHSVEGNSGYHTSKLASVKLFDYVHAEHPDFFVLNIQPGVIKTAMYDKQMEASGRQLPADDSEYRLHSFHYVHDTNCHVVSLPAHFAVWASSPEARFLNGKFVWAHWDVEELKAMASEIQDTNKFTLGLLGWE